jgi:hypothetical protein
MHDLSLSITAEPFDSEDARRLVAALDAALTELYPPEQRFGPNSPTSISLEKHL